MPEGPSILILAEATRTFEGKRVREVSGNAKIQLQRMRLQKIRSIQSWGKHYLLGFNGFYLRIHFLLFGSYRINERREFPPRLSLSFANGELNFYNCSVKMMEGSPEEHYDWSTDLMSDQWNAAQALRP